MRDSAAQKRTDLALSEVIGFVLIIALIVIVASLYLTYGVPAQGRENEILHMTEVKDEFVSYKLSLDSLFNNNKVGTSVSNSFTPGTTGGYSQGMMGFIPIMSPVGSSGLITINDPVHDEVLTIQSQSLIVDPSNRAVTELPSTGTPQRIMNRPQNLYVNISVSVGTDLTSKRYGTQVSGTGWKAVVNLTPRLTNLPTISNQSSSTCPQGTQLTGTSGSGSGMLYYCMNPAGGLVYNGTDIGVTVIKGTSTTLQDLPVIRTVTAGRTYTVDLMDPAYGLESVMTYPDNLSLSNTYTSTGISGRGNATYGYREMTYTMPPVALGSLEYQAQNSYWIPQTYYYQMGGVFLSQYDGNVTWKLPPAISISNDTVDNTVKVLNINVLAFESSASGKIGGNSPVQIKTTLNRMSHLPYATVSPGNGNTKSIRLALNTTDNQSRTLWQNYFNYMVKTNAVSSTTAGTVGNETYIVINSADPNRYGINVVAWNASYTPSVQGVGGIAQ